MNPNIITLVESLQKVGEPHFEVNKNKFEADLIRANAAPTSWIIRIVTMLGAWISAACFFGVISLMGIFDSPMAITILGIVLTAVAIFAFQTVNQKVFTIPYALTASITGQICIGYGLTGWLNLSDMDLLLWVGIGIQVLMFILSKNHVQRFITVLVVNLLGVGLLFSNKLYEGIHWITGLNALIFTALILGEEIVLSRYKKLIAAFDSLNAGTAFSFLLLTFIRLGELTFSFREISIRFWWISAAFILMCLIGVIYKISLDFEWNPVKTIPLCLIFVPFLWGYSGILGGVLMLAVGYYHKNLWFIVMGVLALGVFISVFYYNLQLTLWTKSLILIGSGILFLVGWKLLGYFIRKHYPNTNTAPF